MFGVRLLRKTKRVKCWVKSLLLVKEAEKKKDINLVIQGNALKRKTEETEVEIRKLKESLKVLIEKQKKF